MNPLALLAVSLAVIVGLTSAQVISPPVAPYFGPFGPMFPALGPFGGMIAGLGALAQFGPFGPMGPLSMGLGSFGPLGPARLGGIRGRRALDKALHGSKKAHGDIKCELTRDLLNCTGPHEIIQCEIESHAKIPLELGHFKLNDFTIREKVINKVETLKILPKKLSHRMGHKLEHLAFYDNKKMSETEPGFFVKDPSCFNDVLTLVKELPDKIKLTLSETITKQ